MRKEYIVGIDEVGRGCICGPVTACALMFNPLANPLAPVPFSKVERLADSKSIDAAERNYLSTHLRAECLWGIGWVFPHIIDRINIHHASLLAMSQAFDALIRALDSNMPAIAQSEHLPRIAPQDVHILVDGKFVPPIDKKFMRISAIIKGDTKINEIKAASILAKTTRDSYMELFHESYPMYGLHTHKGYPTKTHKERVSIHGTCPFHRMSFKLQ